MIRKCRLECNTFLRIDTYFKILWHITYVARLANKSHIFNFVCSLSFYCNYIHRWKLTFNSSNYIPLSCVVEAKKAATLYACQATTQKKTQKREYLNSCHFGLNYFHSNSDEWLLQVVSFDVFTYEQTNSVEEANEKKTEHIWDVCQTRDRLNFNIGELNGRLFSLAVDMKWMLYNTSRISTKTKK